MLEKPIEVEQLVINPGHASGLELGGKDLRRVKLLATGLLVEDILQSEHLESDDREQVRSFRGFRMACRMVGGDLQVMVAPDAQGRRRAAVFTTVEAADRFKAATAERYDYTPMIKRFDGATLFAYLADAPVDGIVINCMGPGTPRELSLAFARGVLKL